MQREINEFDRYASRLTDCMACALKVFVVINTINK